MKWLDALERRFRRYAIPNLINYVIVGQIIVFCTALMVRGDIANLLSLTRSGLFAGQVWRLVTFLFVPDTYSFLGFILSCYFSWLVGSSLEREWGTGWFNIYYLAGVVGAWLACLLTGYASGYNLWLSLFLAFAILYPHVRVMLFFVIPIEVKWLGILSGGLWLLSFLVVSPLQKLGSVLGMLGFLLFFGPELWRSVCAWYRREQWRRRNRR